MWFNYIIGCGLDYQVLGLGLDCQVIGLDCQVLGLDLEVLITRLVSGLAIDI
jgi:hypothetical protein